MRYDGGFVCLEVQNILFKVIQKTQPNLFLDVFSANRFFDFAKTLSICLEFFH